MVLFGAAVVGSRFAVDTLLWSIGLGVVIVFWAILKFFKDVGEENPYILWFMEMLIFGMGYALTITYMWMSGAQQSAPSGSNETAGLIFGGMGMIGISKRKGSRGRRLTRDERGEMGAVGAGIGGVFRSVSYGIIFLFGAVVAIVLWLIVPDMVIMFALLFFGLVILITGLTHPAVKGVPKILAVILGFALMGVGAGQAVLALVDTHPQISTESVDLFPKPGVSCFHSHVEFQNGKSATNEPNDPNIQATMFATSWKQGVKSETVVGALYMKLSCVAHKEMKVKTNIYRFTDASLVSDPKAPSLGEMELVSQGPEVVVDQHAYQGWVLVQTVTAKVQGQFVGYLTLLGQWGAKNAPLQLGGYDYAYMESGGGSIEIDSDKDVFEFGDTVPFKISTGFSGNQNNNPQGWFLRIFDPKGQLYHTIYDIPDFLDDSTIYSWTIPETAPFYDDIKNVWKAELNNGLFGIASTVFFTVDDITYIPNAPEIMLDKVSYEVGDDVILDLQADPNEQSNMQISEFMVWVWTGSPATMPSDPNDANWIVRETNITASGNQASYSFECKVAGNMVVKANAWDEANYPSPSSIKEVMVYEKDQKPPLADWGFDWFLLLLLIIIPTTILVVGYAVYRALKRGR